MEIISSTLYAIIFGVAISATYYIGKFILFILSKAFIRTSRKGDKARENGAARCSSYTVIFPIFCALIYSVYLYITVDGTLRFPPLISGALGFFIFSHYIATPLRRRAALMFSARKSKRNMPDARNKSLY